MDIPAVHLLCLEKQDCSLEDHADLAFLTHCPDSCLRTFYDVRLNTAMKAKLSGEGLHGGFAAFVEWVLVNCVSAYTIGAVEDVTSPTSNPVVVEYK